MATWPSSLPQNLNTDGFSLTQQDQTVRTGMDAGPDFVRRRFTAATAQLSGSIVVDETQYGTFWSFFNNTLSGGSAQFDWTHPVDGSPATMRFSAVPSVSAAGGGLYRVDMQLEILP